MTALRRRSAPAALAVLAAALLSAEAAADHPQQVDQGARRSHAVIPVDAMPPGLRAAYIVGIREELEAHGYDPGPPEAAPTHRMAAAIRAYQQDAGLPADGVASKELLDHLKFVLPKVTAARALPGAGAFDPQASRPPAPLGPLPDEEPGYWPDGVTSEPLPDLPAPPPDQATTAPPPDVPPPPAGPEAEPRPTIGGVVSQVQAELKRRGYFPGPVDGRFSPETSAAVRRFQEDNGLPVDGVINSALLNALEEAPAAAPRSEAPAPLDSEGGEGGKL